MTKEITTRISPESIEIANAYLETGDITAVSAVLNVPRDVVSEYLNKREVKKYIDSVYLDTGYRNRSHGYVDRQEARRSRRDRDVLE